MCIEWIARRTLVKLGELVVLGYDHIFDRFVFFSFTGCELKADKDYHFKVDNDENEHQLSLRTVFKL